METQQVYGDVEGFTLGNVVTMKVPISGQYQYICSHRLCRFIDDEVVKLNR